MERGQGVAELLIDIEAELRQLGQWRDDAPPAAALRSEQPFAVDTLDFAQWLQFIFIPRMRFLVAGGHALPTNCAIAPMAEEVYRHQRLPTAALIAVLQAVDASLSEA